MQDFYNLADVYMDAVFHPRCLTDGAVFQQEGWHYELDADDADMQFKVRFHDLDELDAGDAHMQCSLSLLAW